MTQSSAGWLGGFRDLIRRSIAARLLTIALASVVGLAAIGFVAHAQFNRQMLRLLIDPELDSVANHLIANAASGLAGEVALRDLPFDPRYLLPLSGRYFQIAHVADDGSLELQYISPSLVDVAIDVGDDMRTVLAADPPPSGPIYFNIEGPDAGEPLRVVARVQEIPGLEGRYVFIVGIAPRAALAAASDVVGLAFAVFLIFCAGIVAVVTAVQVRIGLAPLHALSDDIASVRRGDSQRLDGDYPAELKSVTQELNALVDHNREVVERARRHVGNLAHALKTPIAVLKNAAADGGEEDTVKQSIEEMEAFVERQLRRARVAARAEASAGSTIAYRTPVLQNLEDLVFMMEQKYDTQKAVDISIEAEADVTFRGEREDLLEMVANLIDNACKYGESAVIVRLLPPFEDGLFEIVVEDDGPGLSDAELERAMARGSRLDEAAPGQGLGLSILKETVDLYAGEILFERAQLGGLKARLRLPATD